MNNGYSGPFVVKFITFEYTRLLDINNQYHNNFKVADALVTARNNNLQLVCFNRPEGKELAFCKIIDFNKWQYMEEKKKKKQNLESRRETKEMQFSPHIADNDIEHKMRKVSEILEDGDEVVLTMQLKGRDKLHINEAEERMNLILQKCDNGREVSRKKTDNMIIIRLAKTHKINKETVNEKNSNVSSSVVGQ